MQRGIDFIRADRAPTTARAYDSHFRRFAAFCSALGRPSIPAEPLTVFAYLVSYAESGVLFGAISVACAAIAFEHRRHLYPRSPTDDPTILSLRHALKRALAAAARQRETIPISALVHLAEEFASPEACLVSLMLSTYMICSVAGLFRFSDWAGVRPSSLQFRDDLSLVEITVPHRKNDQYCQGHLVVLAAGSTAACPVRLLHRYVQALAAHDAEQGRSPSHSQLPLFRSFVGYRYRLGTHLAAPAVPLSHMPLSYNQARNYTVQFLAHALGLEPAEVQSRFGTHSFRRTGASALAASGASVETIRQAGGWANETSPLRYIEYLCSIECTDRGSADPASCGPLAPAPAP